MTNVYDKKQVLEACKKEIDRLEGLRDARLRVLQSKWDEKVESVMLKRRWFGLGRTRTREEAEDLLSNNSTFLSSKYRHERDVYYTEEHYGRLIGKAQEILIVAEHALGDTVNLTRDEANHIF